MVYLMKWISHQTMILVALFMNPNHYPHHIPQMIANHFSIDLSQVQVV